MTVLIGGMRVLKTNVGETDHGVFTERPESLTNDFFVNLLDMGIEWKQVSPCGNAFRGLQTARPAIPSGRPRGSTSSSAPTPSSAPWRKSTEARTGEKKFVHDFVAAWTKVMNLDRFDLARSSGQ